MKDFLETSFPLDEKKSIASRILWKIEKNFFLN